MSKELETLRELKYIKIDEESDGEPIFLSDRYSKEFSIIEKTLDQAEKNEKILEMFKAFLKGRVSFETGFIILHLEPNFKYKIPMPKDREEFWAFKDWLQS